MSELRWNPLLGTYTMVAANRQNRPHMPANWCPFCPSSGKVPANYEVHLYPNDFPVLSQQPQAIINTPNPYSSPYHAALAHGYCEVILYSPNHHAKLYELSIPHITKLVKLWKERHLYIKKDKQVKYIFIFENRGEEVGVTMPHPHGQLYAYPFVPLKIKVELENCQQYYETNNTCLICKINQTEQKNKSRLITENEHFIAYLPYFTDYPFGVFISSKKHLASFADFEASHEIALAEILKNITGAFDQIYDRPFPYMMCIHQTPVNATEYEGCEKYYHFHIEFYPPLRAKDKVKWYASSEMGAWAAANVVAVEDSAVQLRAALEKFLSK